jgi:hypothetical protein
MWTTDFPGRVGFYWLRFLAPHGYNCIVPGRPGKPTVVHITESFGIFTVNFPGTDLAPMAKKLEPCEWWFPPIEEPPR